MQRSKSFEISALIAATLTITAPTLGQAQRDSADPMRAYRAISTQEVAPFEEALNQKLREEGVEVPVTLVPMSGIQFDRHVRLVKAQIADWSVDHGTAVFGGACVGGGAAAGASVIWHGPVRRSAQEALAIQDWNCHLREFDSGFSSVMWWKKNQVYYLWSSTTTFDPKQISAEPPAPGISMKITRTESIHVPVLIGAEFDHVVDQVAERVLPLPQGEQPTRLPKFRRILVLEALEKAGYPIPAAPALELRTGLDEHWPRTHAERLESGFDLNPKAVMGQFAEVVKFQGIDEGVSVEVFRKNFRGPEGEALGALKGRRAFQLTLLSIYASAIGAMLGIAVFYAVGYRSPQLKYPPSRTDPCPLPPGYRPRSAS